MFHRRKHIAPRPVPYRIPTPPSFWDAPDFGGHVMESSTGSWVPDRHTFSEAVSS